MQARDYQCDVCVENHRGPKLANPSTIHEHRDFNDVVGCDGAYWKGSMGVTYHFLHFIDESTLFHLGALSGRTVGTNRYPLLKMFGCSGLVHAKHFTWILLESM